MAQPAGSDLPHGSHVRVDLVYEYIRPGEAYYYGQVRVPVEVLHAASVGNVGWQLDILRRVRTAINAEFRLGLFRLVWDLDCIKRVEILPGDNRSLVHSAWKVDLTPLPNGQLLLC